MRQQANKAFCFRPSIDALETIEAALASYEMHPSTALRALLEEPEVWKIVSFRAEIGRFLQACEQLREAEAEPTD